MNAINIFAALTPCETRVAEYLAWGACKKEAASLLNISVRTVENHARNIYEKVGCRAVNELSAWWFCTRYNISFDLSPLKRRVITTIMTILLLFAECANPGNYAKFSQRQ